jgi:hypothetical protein
VTNSLGAGSELPRRIPGATEFPAHAVSTVSLALLIRVAVAIDEWAAEDRRRNRSRVESQPGG